MGQAKGALSRIGIGQLLQLLLQCSQLAASSTETVTQLCGVAEQQGKVSWAPSWQLSLQASGWLVSMLVSTLSGSLNRPPCANDRKMLLCDV